MLDQTRARDPAFPEPHFTADTLLNGGVRLRQPAVGYRAAIDPVFLAAAVPAKPGERVLDAGCGAGAAFLCLARRVHGCTIAGVERDPAMADLARFNATDNGFSNRVEIFTGNIAGHMPQLGSVSFDHVMMNPPYLDPARTQGPVDAARAAAMVETNAISDWIAFAHRMLRSGGTLALIHRADRLAAVRSALSSRFGALMEFPLLPMAGRDAKRVVVRAQRDAAPSVTQLPGLVLHRSDGRYTAEADEILRAGGALHFPDSVPLPASGAA